MTQLVTPDPFALAADIFDPPHQKDPVGWMEAHGGEMWSRQKKVAESLVHNRYTAVHSCHGTGKSFNASALACWWLDVHPAGEAFVVTTAPTWQQVHAILWREMRKLHGKAELPGRMTLDCHWYMNGQGTDVDELVAYGRKPADYNQAAFQGIHARYVLVIIDEAGGVPKLLYDAVDSLVTNANSRVLAIGNPDDPSSQFEKVCRPGSGWEVIHIGYEDTPAFTGEDVSEDLLELLISPEWVEEREKRWGVSSPTFISKVLGLFPDVSDDTLLAPSTIKACQVLELKGIEKGSFGGDIARFGTDETCVYRNRGGKVRGVYWKHKQDTTATTRAFKKILLERHREVPMWVDADGLGAGVFDNLNNAGFPALEFRGGKQAHDPKRFGNLRAEMYWEFKRECEEGLIDLPLDSEDEDLIAQLGSIKWKLDAKGKIWIESKEEMKKRLGAEASPDRADAAVMASLSPAGHHLSTRLENKRKMKSKKRKKTITGGIMKKVM